MLIDILNNDAFSLSTLTAAISNGVYKPGRLGAMGIFEEDGIATTTATIEVEDKVLSIVPVASRGAPGQTLEKTGRKAVGFVVPHLPQNDTILADSVQNVRQFGSEDMVESVQATVIKRMETMAQKNELTIESHRVAAIQGKYMDSAGTLQNVYTAFGLTETSVAMGLTVDTTELRDKCSAVIDAVEEGLGGLSYEHIHVMCGKTFWSDLIKHPKVKETYLASVHAAELRGDARQTLTFGSLTFERYNGTSAVAIEATEARAFPVGVMDFLLTRFSPANYAETVNTVGLPYYAKTEAMKFNKGIELEVQSNPLNFCARPKALIKLKRTAT